MRKIKLNKDTEITVDVIKYVLDLHKEEAKRINKLKDYYNNNNDIVYREYNNGSKPKNKISNPYASYITNTAVSVPKCNAISNAIEELSQPNKYGTKIKWADDDIGKNSAIP